MTSPKVPRYRAVNGLLMLVVALVLAGCGWLSSPAPTPSGVFALRTVDVTGGVCASEHCACAGVGLTNTTIEGSPTDPRVVWLSSPGGPDRPVVFPTGFTARFAPTLEVLNASGQVAFVAGQQITGGCVGGDEVLLIGWP
jgi:hypothetical protein